MIKDKYYHSLNKFMAKEEQKAREKKHLISELVWFAVCVALAYPLVTGIMAVTN